MIKMFARANRDVASCAQSLSVRFVLSADYVQLAPCASFPANMFEGINK